MTLSEIAARLTAHLKRFEGDAVINHHDPHYGLAPYWWPSAIIRGRYIQIRYTRYLSGTKLTKSEAIAYLKWLDEGNVGKHWEMLK